MIQKIVLVWASNNTEKYWNKILKDLVAKWYIVYPINPNEDIIEWIKSYKSLSDFLALLNDFDVINFVVPPKITLNILKDNLQKIKDKTIWCQPGTSDDDIVSFLEENNFKNYIVDSCIMLQDLTKYNI